MTTLLSQGQRELLDMLAGQLAGRLAGDMSEAGVAGVVVVTVLDHDGDHLAGARVEVDLAA